MRFKAERIYSTMKKQRFIPYEKLGKRQKRAEDAKRRTAWTLRPVTQRVESKKRYSRKRSPFRYDDSGNGDLSFPARFAGAASLHLRFPDLQRAGRA